MPFSLIYCKTRYKLPHGKTNNMICAPSEDSDQPGHPPSLIRVFAVRMKKPWVLSYPFSAQRRLWSGWADAQADLSLRWAQSHFVCFVMLRLIYQYHNQMSNHLFFFITTCTSNLNENYCQTDLSTINHSDHINPHSEYVTLKISSKLHTRLVARKVTNDAFLCEKLHYFILYFVWIVRKYHFNVWKDYEAFHIWHNMNHIIISYTCTASLVVSM